MSRDGSNVYTLPEAPFTAGTTAVAATMNSNLSDIETALSDSLCRSTETTAATRAFLLTSTDAAAQAAIGGTWVQIEVRAVTASANSNFDLSSTYRRFRLTFQNIQADATGRNLALRFGTAGSGGAFSTTSYVYGGRSITYDTGTGADYGSASAGCVYVTTEITNTGGGSWSGAVEFSPGTSSRGVVVTGNATGGSATTSGQAITGGIWQGGGGSAANALRVYTATGVAAGTAAGTFTGTLILEGMV